jgi:trans-2,3-dihydro-3-hydroxyanthranilate isomerase
MGTRSLRYHLLDVFTRTAFGGNQLAVFPDAPDLDAALMQTIARELNLSECIFLRPLQEGNRVAARIFTPAMELPFAGHPTLGAAALLAELNEGVNHFVLEERVGPIHVDVQASADGVFTELTVATRPQFRDDVPAQLHEILSLNQDDIRQDRLRPRCASVGVPFLIVPLRDLGALQRARVNIALWEQRVAGTWAPHIYVFVETTTQGFDIHARMFAPAMNIAEDPATGGAATALAAYLAAADEADGFWKWRIAQGVEMGRPSELYIQAEERNRVIAGIKVGGFSVVVGEGTLNLP